MTELNLIKLLETAGRNLKNRRVDKMGKVLVKADTVSKATKIDPATISGIETASLPEVKFKHLVTLGDYYNMTVEELFGLANKNVYNNSQVNESDTSSHVMNNHADGYKVFVEHLKEENTQLRAEKLELLDELKRLRANK